MNGSSLVLDKDVQYVLHQLALGTKLKFPYTSDSSSSYRRELEARLDNFINRIDKLDVSKSDFARSIRSRLSELIDLRASILAVIDNYLIGNIGEAYATVEQILTSSIVNKYRPLFR